MKKCILISMIFYCVFSLHGMETSAYQYGYTQEKDNLVQDLDEVLLHEGSSEITERHKLFSRHSFLAVDAQGIHYMVPAYCAEYVKLIDSRYNLSFFSAGLTERNESVVQDMWVKIFKVNKPENMRILSRCDLVKEGKFKKKDITKIGPLNRTVITDDKVYRVLEHQRPNVLRAPGLNFWDPRPINEKHSCAVLYNRIIEHTITDEYEAKHLLSFYKLLYIAGVLDMAAEKSPNIVEGLHALPSDDEELFFERIRDLHYYKRGYRVLSAFAEGGKLPEHFPEIEKYFCDELQPNLFSIESSSSITSENDSID